MEGTGEGEFAAIARIRSLLPAPPPGETWIGDDAAVTADGLLLAADAVVEGVHFRPATPLADVGWKAMVANLSDIAAMGGAPGHALVTVVAPPGLDVHALYAGIREAADQFACPVVGGDLSAGPALVVAVAVTGRVLGGGPPVLRRGARPGDTVFLTGPLGGAQSRGWEGRSTPRLAEGTIARLAGATAMIDVSDGLGADLGHILDESGVGARLEADVDPALGGEDYELVFTAPHVGQVRSAFTHMRPPLEIGEIVADPSERPPATGWVHRGFA